MKRAYGLVLLFVQMQLVAMLPLLKDVSKAKELAQLYNRPLILVFTGSDWCEWSQKICTELFSSDQFADSVGSTFIFVHLDFPYEAAQGAKADEELLKIRKEYGVNEFPTLLMVEPDGREISRLSYSEQSFDKFAFSLKKMFSKFARLQEEVARVDFARVDEAELKHLYNEAVEIKCPTFISDLLEEGLKLDKGVFFPVEKYSQLILEGKADSQEAEHLKEKIVARDRENREGARLRLALLDFQSHQEDPERATKEPLSYISDMGKQQDDNLWRLHLLISEYFSEHGLEAQAKEHAEKSLEKAPEALKPLLKETINYTK